VRRWLPVCVILIELTGPTGQTIHLNPAEVTSIREPTATNRRYFAKGTHCVIFVTNGHFIAVRERCKTVRQKLEAVHNHA